MRGKIFNEALKLVKLDNKHALQTICFHHAFTYYTVDLHKSQTWAVINQLRKQCLAHIQDIGSMLKLVDL